MDAVQIQDLFNREFASLKVTMVGGASEPLYLPGSAGQHAQLRYREDFAASALHEAAHWCIASQTRRQKVDFGYAYVPPPRSEAAQYQFYRLELRAQTLECLFAEVAGVPFQVSADNLDAEIDQFAATVQTNRQAVHEWMMERVDPRARQFYLALKAFSRCCAVVSPATKPAEFDEHDEDDEHIDRKRSNG